MSIDRYSKIIQTALEIQQKRKEIEVLKREFAANITASELKTRSWDKESALKALKTVDGLSFEDAKYVQCQAVYKDIEVHLHCNPMGSPCEAMTHLVSEVSVSDIMQ